MASTNNGTCSLTFSVPVAEPLRLYSLVFVVIVTVTLCSSVCLWFLWRRNHPYLKRRSLSLLLVTVIGYIMQIIAGPLRRYVEGDMPCELISSVFFLCLPYVGWPLTVRVLLWVNKIRFNYKLAKNIALSGATEIRTSDEKLRWPRFYASRKFGLGLVLVVLLPYTIIMVVLVFLYSCRVCDGLTDVAYFIFLLAVLLMILAVLFCLYYTREVPDLFGIRSESKWAFGLACLFGVPGLVLSNYDVGGFEAANPLNFTWGLFVDIGFFLFVIVTLPVQLYYARVISSRKDRDNTGLEELLKTDRGYAFFQLYLATELSLENLLFYSAVDEWRKHCNADSFDGSETAATVARRIYRTYFSRRSLFEVNVSSVTAEKLRSFFASDPSSVPVDIFDEAQEEILHLMAGSSFTNFKSSVFFDLYNGELEAEDVTWLQASGMSSFEFMSESGLASARTAGSAIRRDKILAIKETS